jgi:hypothetical protein
MFTSGKPSICYTSFLKSKPENSTVKCTHKRQKKKNHCLKRHSREKPSQTKCTVLICSHPSEMPMTDKGIERRRRPQLVEAEKKMKMWPTIQFYQIDDQRFNHIKKLLVCF